MPLAPIPEILDDLRAGRVIILVDDEDRENEGDFVCAAEKVTPEIINFMTRVGGGYLCVSLDGETCDRLDLTPQAQVNTSMFGTPFTVSVDGHPRHGVGTGVSAADRAKTIRMLIDPAMTIDDFVRPGHINPLRARDGGVLVRTGQTEGSVDLARLAGMHPSGVIIEIVAESGEMARMPELERIAAEHDLKICSVEQVIAWRIEQEGLVSRLDPAGGAEVELPEGTFRLIAYESAIDAVPHLVLACGDVGRLDERGRPIPIDRPTLVRMHRRDLLGDIFHEKGNPTGDQLHASLRAVQEAGEGAVVYLRTEGSGDDFRSRLQRIRRPASADANVPDLTRADSIAARAHPMDRRDIGIGGQILRDLGLSKLRVLTNHPRPMPGLSGFGVEIVEHVAIGAGR